MLYLEVHHSKVKCYAALNLTTAIVTLDILMSKNKLQNPLSVTSTLNRLKYFHIFVM